MTRPTADRTRDETVVQAIAGVLRKRHPTTPGSFVEEVYDAAVEAGMRSSEFWRRRLDHARQREAIGWARVEDLEAEIERLRDDLDRGGGLMAARERFYVAEDEPGGPACMVVDTHWKTAKRERPVIAYCDTLEDGQLVAGALNETAN